MTNAKMSQEELNSYLWGAAELLRNHIDAGAYKQYIFPLLFFKRLSDVYEEESSAAVAEYGDPEAATWEETHRFVMPAGHRWPDVRNVGKDVGRAIASSFRAIESANSDRLEGIFGDGAWTNKRRLPDALLKDLLEHFSSEVLSLENCPEDELGQGYEYLIKRFADDSGHSAQEFYTNRTVVHLMTRLLAPESGESVYDPTCGTAGMLISCVSYLQEQGKEWRNLSLWGQEINQLTSDIARMNLFLHGIQDFHIANDDTLARPAFLEGGRLRTFDVVLANPPYSIKQWDQVAFSKDPYGRNFLGTPPQGRADYAFIQHILKSLDPERGRCAILLPHGVLFREEERDMRKELIQYDLIEAVIGLGPNLFYNSPMESCILVCKTNKEGVRKGRVLFIDASSEVARKNAQSYLDPGHIERIGMAFGSDDGVPGFSAYAAKKNIEDNDWSLSIRLYARNEQSVVTSHLDGDITIDNAEWDSHSRNAMKGINSLRCKLEGGQDE